VRRALLLACAALACCGGTEPVGPADSAIDPAVDAAVEPAAEPPAEPAPTPEPHAGPSEESHGEPRAFGGTLLVTAAGHWRVAYETRPAVIPLGEPFDVVARVTPAAGNTPLPPGVELAVDAAMPQHGHGMNRTPLHERDGPGAWTARGLLFHMPGAWTLTFDVTLDGLTERAATVVTLE